MLWLDVGNGCVVGGVYGGAGESGGVREEALIIGAGQAPNQINPNPNDSQPTETPAVQLGRVPTRSDEHVLTRASITDVTGPLRS